MHELLMKVTEMCLKVIVFAGVFVLWSVGNELVPPSLNRKYIVYICEAILCHVFEFVQILC